jgi:predicted SprT family Zn-dependent metalloprotease
MLCEEIKMTDKEIIEKLQQLFNDLEIKFDFWIFGVPEIILNPKMRSKNGQVFWENGFYDEEPIVKNVKIIMSKPLLEEFGWERFEKTFRHECAHVMNAIRYNGKNHDINFKRCCQLLGGSMNSKMAKGIFRDCASKEFVRPIPKWEYQCPKCLSILPMAKRMKKSKKESLRHHCITCNTALFYWTEKQVG